MEKKTKKILIITTLVFVSMVMLYKCMINIALIDVTPIPKLHSAAYSGNNFMMKLYLSNDNIESRDHQNRTPLHLAIKGNNLSTVQILIEKGANVRANSSGYKSVPHTPLFYAAREGNLEILNYLITYGATLESSPKALSIAIECGYYEIVLRLLELGADINYQDSWGDTPILDAIRSYHVSQYVSGKPKVNINYKRIVELLLNNGADIHATNEKGNSTLIYAAMLGTEEVTKLLIQEKVSINHKNLENKSALYYAKEKNKTDIIELLIKNGAIE